MITELKLANFRVFGDEVTLRVRPITVLIGENNAGKSTLIKFLLMLQQSLDFDSPELLLSHGAKVQLGAFDGLQNRHAETNELEFELTADVSSDGWAVERYLQARCKAGGGKLRYVAHAKIPYDNTGSADIIHDAKLVLDAEEILAWNKTGETGLLKSAEELAHDQELAGRVEADAQSEMLGKLRANLRDLKHLQADREPFGQGPSSAPFGSVGQDGAYTLAHLQKLDEADGPEYRQILHYLQAAAGIKRVEFERVSNLGSRCFAVNKTTGARVYIGNFGFGVSQCLPVFVQGAIMQPLTQLMVEQPEAQIHPTAQLEMGGFFADLWCKRKVGCIVETHSDNLILRLQRLVARGDLRPEDVSIAYIEAQGKCPVIKNLDIEASGDIAERDGLPMEFFGKSLEEVLHMRAGK